MLIKRYSILCVFVALTFVSPVLGSDWVELGICFLANGDVKQEARRLCVVKTPDRSSFGKDLFQISILQDCFRKSELGELKHILGKYAGDNCIPFDIHMETLIYQNLRNNSLLWPVFHGSPAWNTLLKINKDLSELLVDRSAKPLKRIRDKAQTLSEAVLGKSDEKAERARRSLELIGKYGRDFDVPGRFNPGIKVFEKEKKPLIDDKGCSLKMRVEGLFLVQLDQLGSPVEVVGFFPLGLF